MRAQAASSTPPGEGLFSAAVLLRLAASGRSGLASLLARLRGHSLPGGYLLVDLLGVGGQGMVWLAADLRCKPVAVKLPLLDFHRPWSYGQAEIGHARARLEAEARVLRELAGGLQLLPSFVASGTAQNPLHEPARPPTRVGLDPFVVLERIEGVPLMHHGKALSARGPDGQQELSRVLRVAAFEVLAMQQLLEARGAVYVDFKPEHLLLEPTGQVRLLDAGGVYVWDGEGAPPMPITPRYAGKLPAAVEGRQRANLAARRSLARTLYEVWSGRAAPRRQALVTRLVDAPEWLVALLGDLEGNEPAAWRAALAAVS